MDNTKAIQVLTNYVKFFEAMISRTNCKVPESSLEMIEACTFAVGAIGKQIAKPCKAVKREYSHSDYYCPVCGKQQKNTYKTRREGCFCERCGQRLTLPEPGPKNNEVTTYEFTFG